ncbi:MAG: TonB-dependent receptor [Candidatus Omnitrophica bacterium]|nr:TonB-dependent receptor [Candidatus Omnitrophota bacterium]
MLRVICMAILTLVLWGNTSFSQESVPVKDVTPKKRMSVTLNKEGEITSMNVEEIPQATTPVESQSPIVVKEQTSVKTSENFERRFHWRNVSLPIEGRFSLLGGYRNDDFDWNIAGDINGNNPNVLSELTWSDLAMYQVQAQGQLIIAEHWVADGLASYSDIYDGENQDSDFLANQRTLEFSRSNNQSDNGRVVDLSGGVGYRFSHHSDLDWFAVDQLWVTPLVGYSQHKQDLVITDGFQTVPATGPFAGLHSQYDTEWKGPWWGVELEGTRGKLGGTLRAEYHMVDYYAEADWNLRSDFQHPKSFEHEADGRGLVFRMGLNYQLTRFLSLDFQGTFQDWETDHGIDRVFFSSGSIAETRLNEVNWESYSLLAGATVRF